MIRGLAFRAWKLGESRHHWKTSDQGPRVSRVNQIIGLPWFKKTKGLFLSRLEGPKPSIPSRTVHGFFKTQEDIMGKQLPPREHHLIPKATNLFASSQLVPGFPVRHFSSTGAFVFLAEFLQLLKEKRVCVIDVRVHAELKKDGEIPGCVSVPIGELSKALVMDPYLFEHRYKARMPGKQDRIVFTCLAGIRGKTAMETARSLGYRYVSIYKGGWKEWAQQQKKRTINSLHKN